MLKMKFRVNFNEIIHYFRAYKKLNYFNVFSKKFNTSEFFGAERTKLKKHGNESESSSEFADNVKNLSYLSEDKPHLLKTQNKKVDLSIEEPYLKDELMEKFKEEDNLEHFWKPEENHNLKDSLQERNFKSKRKINE